MKRKKKERPKKRMAKREKQKTTKINMSGIYMTNRAVLIIL
jgi:hypothetical protein